MNDHRLNSGFRRVGDWYMAANAVVVGDVTIGASSSIWYGSVLRGDDDRIVLGARVNIQDLTVVHADPGVPLVIGSDVTVGHRAVIHCRSVGEATLVGMGAILMKDARIGAGCLLAAGTVITPGTQVPDGVLVRGVPGKVVRSLDDDERRSILDSARSYVESARQFAKKYGDE